MSKALDAYAKGQVSVRNVKARYGIPPTSLLRYCRANGIEIHPAGCPGMTRENHPTWKGGQTMTRDGYVRTYAPDHPWPRRGKYVLEHVRVMELSLGRRLRRGEAVHHKDHARTNNAPENLDLVKIGAHSSYHRLLDVAHRARDRRGRFT